MGDNAFLGPMVQVVSSASDDLETLLSRAPRGQLQGVGASLLLQLLGQLGWRLLLLSG